MSNLPPGISEENYGVAMIALLAGRDLQQISENVVSGNLRPQITDPKKLLLNGAPVRQEDPAAHITDSDLLSEAPRPEQAPQVKATELPPPPVAAVINNQALFDVVIDTPKKGKKKKELTYGDIFVSIDKSLKQIVKYLKVLAEKP